MYIVVFWVLFFTSAHLFWTGCCLLCKSSLEANMGVGTVCTTVWPLGLLMVPQRSSHLKVCVHEPVFYTAQ
uniref:Putative secreted protein n=1 Tax=Amblyomma triste TaxID=251400 RepID=A0A023G0N5_AMBTT